MRTSSIVGIVPGSVGSLVMFVGIVFYFIYLYVVRHDVKQYLTISSSDHPDYDSWVMGTYGANTEELVLKVTTITNPSEVLLGAQPVFKVVGPFQYRVATLKDNVTFLDDGNKVNFTMRTYYTEVTEGNTSGADTEVVSYNALLVSLYGRYDAGRVSILFASGALRAALKEDEPTLVGGTWLSNPTHCFDAAATNGACSLAKYCSDNSLPAPTSTLPRLNATFAATMLGVLSTSSGALQFYDEFDALHGGPSGNSKGTLPPNSLTSQWAKFINLTSLAQSSLIMGYMIYTASAVTATMQGRYCTPDSIFFRRQTVTEKVFLREPFTDFLFSGDSVDNPAACYLCNASVMGGLLRTGKDDEDSMGMDMHDSLQLPTLDADGIRRATKLMGRTQSTNPFIYDIPNTLSLSQPILKKPVAYVYNGTYDVSWHLKVRRFVFDIPDEDGYMGAPGYNILLSHWGWHTVGPSRNAVVISGDGTTIDYDRNVPLAVILAEEVSGLGIDNTIMAQYNIKLNYSQILPLTTGPAMPAPPLGSNYSYDTLVWNKTLLPSGVLYVPDVALSLHKYADDDAVHYLSDQTRFAIRALNTMLLSTMCIGAVLVIFSVIWVVWDTQGTAILREGDKRHNNKHYIHKGRR